jgi:hypothetical protein
MLLKELKWNGLFIWPPQWAEESPNVIENGLLKRVNILPLTDLKKLMLCMQGISSVV